MFPRLRRFTILLWPRRALGVRGKPHRRALCLTNGTMTPGIGSARMAMRIGSSMRNGLMRLRLVSINDLPIKQPERKYHWALGRRPVLRCPYAPQRTERLDTGAKDLTLRSFIFAFSSTCGYFHHIRRFLNERYI